MMKKPTFAGAVRSAMESINPHLFWIESVHSDKRKSGRRVKVVLVKNYVPCTALLEQIKGFISPLFSEYSITVKNWGNDSIVVHFNKKE